MKGSSSRSSSNGGTDTTGTLFEHTEKLADLIETIVTRGDPELDADLLKQIKSICKQSDDFVRWAYEVIQTHIQKQHAQIRYSCLQLVDVLFNRSHAFRQAVLSNFPVFLQYIIGIHGHPLPPPKVYTRKLKSLGLALVKEWNQKFGGSYKALSLGHNFMMESLGSGVLQDTVDVETSSQRAQREQMERRKKQRKWRETVADIQISQQEINDTLLRMESCFEILVPDPLTGVTSHQKAESKSSTTQQSSLRSLGLPKNYELELTLSAADVRTTESKDNAVIFQELREDYNVLKKRWNKKVSVWLDALTKNLTEDHNENQEIMKKLIDLRNQIADAMGKCRDLNLFPEESSSTQEDSVAQQQEQDAELFGDEEFEEVPLPSSDAEQDSSSSSETARIEQSDPSKASITPTTVASTADASAPIFKSPEPPFTLSTASAASIPQPTHQDKGKSRAPLVQGDRSELLKLAPEVGYDEDLYWWDKTELQFNQMSSGIEKSHRFMGTSEGENYVSKDTLNQLKKRVVTVEFEYPQEFPPCRAPLPNGGLCQRRDMERCPFHGKIIARDDNGVPLDPAYIQPVIKDIFAPIESSIPVPEGLMSKSTEEAVRRILNIPSATGSSSTTSTLAGSSSTGNITSSTSSSPRPNKRRKEKEESRLIDLKKESDNPRSRLMRRLNNKSSQRRIREQLEDEQEMQRRDRNASDWG